jgi:Fe-S cluster biogenesis protein NfuA
MLSLHHPGEYKCRNKGVSMREQVEKVLNEIRPNLQADGGDVEFVDVNDGIVKVKLTGSCAGCPMSTLTLKMGIERLLKEKIADVKEVVAVD